MANRESSNLFKTVIGIITIVAVIWLIFQIVAGLYNLLWYIGPVLLIATLFMDKDVVLSYVKWIGKLFKTSPVAGLGAGVLSFFGFPFVSAFLFGKAFLKKKLNISSQETKQRQETNYTDYEELESKSLNEIDLELKDLEKDIEEIDGNDYEEFFEGNK